MCMNRKSCGTIIFQLKMTEKKRNNSTPHCNEFERLKSCLWATNSVIFYFIRGECLMAHFVRVSIRWKTLYRSTCCQVESGALMIEPNGKSTVAVDKNLRPLGRHKIQHQTQSFFFIFYMQQLSAILLCWTSLSLDVGSLSVATLWQSVFGMW